jgi:Fic family protein
MIRLIGMNDTKSAIWKLFALNSDREMSSSEVFELLQLDVSLVTVKRYLSELEFDQILVVLGDGRSTRYRLGWQGKIHAPINTDEYFGLPELGRRGQTVYNFDLIDNIGECALFSAEQISAMNHATEVYHSRISTMSDTLHKKELERFVIELSWKSSKIEGNTYTLLDTEKLIRDGVPAEGHKPEEATMILNHKKAFDYVLTLCKNNGEITEQDIHVLHKLLVQDLDVNTGLRSGPVGITGSTYRPIDIPSVISEQFTKLVKVINTKTDPYSKALLAILGVSYLQPYEDGNKRTARLLANAFLLVGKCAPLSYRNVDEGLYRNSLLVFYEQNSIEAFKKIFIEQYLFSCEYYNVQ